MNSIFEKVFVIAMQSEADPIISHINQISTEIKYSNKIITGILFEQKVCIVICGIGKVNAARGTQYAIDVLGAKQIINIGYAGALNSTMQVGKIYQIKSAVEYDFDLAELNHTEIGVLNEFDDKYLYTSTISGFESKILGTGDRFNDSKVDYNLLVNDIKADIRDMEGAAILHTAIHAGVPVYMFKIISDVVGSEATTDQFLQNLDLCAKTLDHEIENLFSSL